LALKIKRPKLIIIAVKKAFHKFDSLSK